jgi:hypothetical protein
MNSDTYFTAINYNIESTKINEELKIMFIFFFIKCNKIIIMFKIQTAIKT